MTDVKVGALYAGHPPQSASDGVNLTCKRLHSKLPSLMLKTFKVSEDSSDASKWMVTPSDGSPSQVLYAITTGGQYQAIKYSSNPPQGSVTNGWSWMGDQVFYKSNEELTAQFWANPTVTKKWIIGWNSDNKNNGQAVPVALKRSPPSNTEPPGHKRLPPKRA
jgi:hypothetical protein